MQRFHSQRQIKKNKKVNSQLDVSEVDHLIEMSMPKMIQREG